MRISVQWLKELVPNDLSAADIAALFTARGIGAEEIVRIGEPFDAALVSEVVSVQDRSVTLFDGKDVVDMEFPTSQLAPDAKIAFLPATKRILVEQDVGLEGSELPIVLPPGAETGSPALAQFDDEVLILEVPPNRADLTGVLGAARELAGYLDRAFSVESLALKEGNERIGDCFHLDVRDMSDTPDYIARLLRGVRVAPSPFWLKWRLLACGVRPISNVVDVTNYILFKYGQPLHGFDYQKLAGRQLITRRATKGEALTTIDGIERQLNDDVLVIADRDRPVAIAGVMGGLATEITDSTSDVLIECARFASAVIRRGSRSLGLATEASQRFEVGLDVGAMESASREAAAMMQMLAGGTPLAGAVAVRTPAPAVGLELSWRRTTQLLGMDLSPANMGGILNRLGFKVQGEGDPVHVDVPSHRPDVETAADLAEEIGRIAGYDGVPGDTRYVAYEGGQRDFRSKHIGQVRQAMLGLGFDEIQSVSFVTERIARMLDGNPPVFLTKPLNERYAVLRPSLLAGLLEAISLNLRRGNQDVRVFELGTVCTGADDPVERTSFAAALTGMRSPLFWGAAAQPIDFYDISGTFSTLLQSLGVAGVTLQPVDAIGFEPGETAAIMAGATHLGLLGRIGADLAQEFGIQAPVMAFEIDVERAGPLLPGDRFYHELPKFPAVVRDFALVVDEAVPAARMLDLARLTLGAVAEEAEVFDSFSGGALPAGKRSIGIRLTFRASDHTLTTAELEEMSSRLVAALGHELDAELRR
jgi:phenylalanyl-tRNA synthetase beta chain